jgi:predicted metalloprotease with PDZ domain
LPKDAGLSVLPLNAQIARQLGLSEDTKGLVINAVDPNSDAGEKELQRGDVILSVGNRAITTVAELEAGIRAAQSAGRTAIGVQIVRPGQPPLYIGLRLQETQETQDVTSPAFSPIGARVALKHQGPTPLLLLYSTQRAGKLQRLAHGSLGQLAIHIT